MNKWNKCCDSTPDFGEPVQVWIAGVPGYVGMAIKRDRGQCYQWDMLYPQPFKVESFVITHWAPLPEPPK